MPKITKRLKAAAELLPRCKVIADIGCDHGLLSAYLIAQSRCDQVIAVDISPFSVEKTRKLAEVQGWEDRIKVRQGNGFEALTPNEADAAVLAGLGGELIAQLIDKTRPAIPMVLQPMQQSEQLRAYLRTHGYCLAEERMVEENGRIHELLLVVPGKYRICEEIPEAIRDEVGPVLFERRDPLLAKRLRIKADAIAKKASAAKTSPEAREKLMEHVELLRTAARTIDGGE